MKVRLSLVVLVLLCISLSSRGAFAQIQIQRHSDSCPEIVTAESDNFIQFRSSEDMRVTIRNYASFLPANSSSQSGDGLVVEYEATGEFGEKIAQQQTLSYSELIESPEKGIIALEPIVHQHTASGEFTYDVLAPHETLINYAQALDQSAARTILHIARSSEFDPTTASFGNTLFTILITPQAIICDEASEDIAPLGNPLEHYKLLHLYNSSVTNTGRATQEANAVLNQLREQRDQLLGEQEQLASENHDMKGHIEQITRDLAVQVDTTERAINVAKQKARELETARAEIQRLESANYTLGTTLDKLLRGVFRLQKTMYKRIKKGLYRGSGVEETYRRLNRLQKKASKNLGNNKR